MRQILLLQNAINLLYFYLRCDIIRDDVALFCAALAAARTSYSDGGML